MNSKEEIENSILKYLYKNNYIGKKHTPKENICHRLNIYSCKDVYRSIKKLYKKQYVGIHMTHHGQDIYLTPSKLDEIKKRIS